MKIEESYKIPDYNGCGVYAIINIVDFKAYIGSSRNIKRRAYQHLYNLKQKKHCIKKLQNDCEKGLKFIILDKYDNIDDGKLLISEYSFMKKFLDRNFELYNISPFKGIIDKRKQLDQLILAEVSREYRGLAEKAIKEEFGVYPWDVYIRKIENRKELLFRK